MCAAAERGANGSRPFRRRSSPPCSQRASPLDKSTQEMLRGYMAKAEEKLGVARRLLAQGDVEDAISRAYYAAFHAVAEAFVAEIRRHVASCL